jgi:4-hydroxy-3-polyprenylbenzoate decarboxylase
LNNGMSGSAAPHRQSMRAWLASLEDRGQLRTITALVGLDYEIAACLAEADRGPALRFERVAGHAMPVVGNLLNGLSWFAAAVGVSTATLQSRIIAAIDKPLRPRITDAAACQQHVVSNPELTRELPIPRFFEHETGPYITAGAIVAKDSLTGRANLSIARLKPLGGNRAMVGIAPNHHLAVLARATRERGQKLDIAVTVGNHPAVLLAACLYLQLGEDELEVAGGLLGEPIEAVRCLSSDLVVPAQCECVLEGTLDLDQEIDEGPVSEFHGLYENYGRGVVATFSRLTRRADAIFQVVLPGYHPEHCLLGGVAIAAGLARVARASVVCVTQVAVGFGGAGRLHAVVALKDPRPGDARKVMFAIWAAVNLIKRVIVVDDDIDPWDIEQVDWAMATRSRPERDLIVIPGVRADRSEPLDEAGVITKLGIDATRRAQDRADWRWAQPPADAIKKARELLASTPSTPIGSASTNGGSRVASRSQQN